MPIARHLRFWLLVAEVMLAGIVMMCGPAAAAGYGAGAIEMRITPCLIAARSNNGTPCQPPARRDTDGPRERAAAHLDRALFFVDLQDAAAARAEVDAALALEPESVDALHLSARLALLSGMIDTTRAGRDLAAALRLAPHDPDVQTTYAFLLRCRGAARESVRHLDEIIRSHPRHIAARLLRGEQLLEMKRADEAVADLDVVVSEDPSRRMAVEMLATTLVALGRPDRAVAAYNIGLTNSPDDYALLRGRIDAYERQGNDDGALRDLDAILGGRTDSRKPNYAVAGDDHGRLLMQRAMIHARARRVDDASADAVSSVVLGGVPSVLRAQILLRHNGFPDTPLDGRFSEPLRQSIKACFGLQTCFAQWVHRI